jgi:Family of unknown function (DUF6879)
MHPRLLARQDCSGGTCPAVYDLDDLPGDLVIQGKKAGAYLLGRLTGLADDETAVIIPRRIVTQALQPALERVDIAHLQAQFETFSYSAFRLETLQDYQYTAKDDQWVALLRANRRWGKTHQRVHVITEPLTPAMQQELTEGYAGNVAAGEDIRVIATAPGDWPDDVPRLDFWLFDSARMYVMHYGPGGEWAGASRVPIPESIVKACQARDAALHRAVPWNTYIASRPDLQRRLAQ